MDSKLIIIVFLITLIIKSKSCSSNVKSNDDSSKTVSRNSRALYTPNNSGLGISVAVSVPLDNGRGNVFLSWCIGVGPGTPAYDSPGLDPPPFQTFYKDALNARKLQTRNGFLTRRKFYSGIIKKLKQSGFNGKSCILKAICEMAQYKFGNNNGVLGDILHIIFTPTASKDEQLPTRYYEAEANGHLNLCDKFYSEKCPTSVFDLITIFM